MKCKKCEEEPPYSDLVYTYPGFICKRCYKKESVISIIALVSIMVAVIMFVRSQTL